jgi:hypothetical protein
MRFRIFSLFLITVLAFMSLGIWTSEAVTAAPAITIHPKSGAPGTKVVVSGSNFSSYKGDRLSIFFNNVEIPRIAVSVPSSGSFELVFEVPEKVEPGEVSVSIRGESGESLAGEIFTIPVPDLILSTWDGEVSTKLIVRARGFHVGKNVDFYYSLGGININIGNQIAQDPGECSIEFVIPESPRGRHGITATNSEGQRAEVNFSIVPAIKLEPSTAAVGDKITVSGSGFTMDNEISVNLYSNKIARATASILGSFSVDFVVPVLRAGKYLVAVEDVNREVKWAELTIISRISLNKDLGEVGAKLTVSGTGFEIRNIVTIKFDTDEILTVKTNDIGAFTGNITVPICPPGAHVITATDGYNLRQAVYTVESESPLAPTPLSPRGYDDVSSPFIIDWEGVYDISQPLVYSIQIARSPDFRHPVLEKSELIASQLTIGNGQTLQPSRRGTYYYWRIRAVDGASNVGEWSSTAVFRVKPVDILPVWLRNVLIAAQVLIAGVLGYRTWKGFKAS